MNSSARQAPCRACSRNLPTRLQFYENFGRNLAPNIGRDQRDEEHMKSFACWASRARSAAAGAAAFAAVCAACAAAGCSASRYCSSFCDRTYGSTGHRPVLRRVVDSCWHTYVTESCLLKHLAESSQHTPDMAWHSSAERFRLRWHQHSGRISHREAPERLGLPAAQYKMRSINSHPR